MDDYAVNSQPPHSFGLPQHRKYPKKKPPQHSGNIVFSKGNSIQTVPSLGKQVKGITECTIGLQYVWEYRSPSKSVQPHYQCKLCCVSLLQYDIIDHIKGWKHSFRYMKKKYPDKVPWEEEEVIKDTVFRKAVKVAAAEVEQTEGKGQIKVVLKEPFEVPAFRGLRSAVPHPEQPHGPMHMGPPFNPRFSRPFPPRDDTFFNGPLDEHSEPGFGGFPPMPDFPDPGRDQSSFPGGMGDHSTMVGRDDYLSQEHDENPGKMYPDKLRAGPMDGPVNRSQDGQGSKGPVSHNLSNTLLSYLDTFRIENENDAQLVLKVTQKLTDVLMEYRLRSVSSSSSLNSCSMSDNNFTPSPSRFPGGSNRFSDRSGYSDGPSRFFS